MDELKTREEYWENGQIRLKATELAGVFHGRFQLWHRNGQLQCDLHYKHGLLDGEGVYWDVKGREICRFHIVNGTGMQREPGPTPNALIAIAETSWVQGLRHGLDRMLDSLGLVINESYWLNGSNVRREEYVCACDKDALLRRPTITDPRMRSPWLSPDSDAIGKAILATKQVYEARSWFGDPEHECTLGEDTDVAASRAIAEQFYAAGAEKVWVFDVIEDDHNSGRLLIELPNDPLKRSQVLRICGRWARKGGFTPDKDKGQHYALVMLD